MRLFISFLFISISLIAQTADDLFHQAAKHYEQREYESALDLYNQIESSGQFSSEVYFNKANCYYKMQQNAEAVLYYEKALKLNPSDEDVLFNLKLVQLQLVDKLAHVPQPFYQKWIKSFKNIMHIDSWAKTGLFFLFTFCILFVTFLFSNKYSLKKSVFNFSMFSFSIALITLTMAYYGYSTQIKEAILMQDNAYIKSAPSSQSEDLFILHEGTKVEVLEIFNEWTKIKLSDGMIGWLEKNAVEII